MPSRATLAAVLAAAAVSSGCSKLMPKLDEVVPDNRKAYQKAESLPDLEVPPDLSTEAIQDRMAIPEGGETARYSTYQERRAERKRAEELDKAQSSAIRVLENEHVLAAQGAPVQIWPQLEEFWRSQGYELELDDLDLGIIETAWNEDEAGLSRDKFKIFAEKGEQSGTTLLYISREEEELVPQGEDLVWQRRPRDVELERTVVERLETALNGAAPEGGERRVAAAGPGAPAAAASDADTAPETGTPAPVAGPRHAELVSVGDGKVYLTVAEDFPSAWKTTGRALEKAGVAVKDSDKGRGIYVVEVAGADQGESNSGVWDKLKFWDRGNAAEYQVSLTGVGEKTEVVVLDRNGRWETGDQAGILLNKLHDALNSGHI